MARPARVVRPGCEAGRAFGFWGSGARGPCGPLPGACGLWGAGQAGFGGIAAAAGRARGGWGGAWGRAWGRACGCPGGRDRGVADRGVADRGQQVGDVASGLLGRGISLGSLVFSLLAPLVRLFAGWPAVRVVRDHGGRAGAQRGGRRAGRGQVQGAGLGAQPVGRRAVGRVPGQGRGQQRHQRPGDAGQVGVAGDDAVEDRLERVAAPAVRRAPGGRVRHRRAPGVHVGGRAARLALDHLGSQVPGRPHDQAGLGQPGGVRGLGDAEVDHHRAVVGEHHVARLEVAVHHARGVDRGQRRRGAVGQPAQARAGQRPAAAHHGLQRRAGHVPGDDIGELAGHVGVQHLRDERAADPAHGLDLAGQAEAGVGALGGVGMEHLDGHQAALRIPGEVDHPHAAFP